MKFKYIAETVRKAIYKDGDKIIYEDGCWVFISDINKNEKNPGKYCWEIDKKTKQGKLLRMPNTVNCMSDDIQDNIKKDEQEAREFYEGDGQWIEDDVKNLKNRVVGQVEKGSVADVFGITSRRLTMDKELHVLKMKQEAIKLWNYLDMFNNREINEAKHKLKECVTLAVNGICMTLSPKDNDDLYRGHVRSDGTTIKNRKEFMQYCGELERAYNKENKGITNE